MKKITFLIACLVSLNTIVAQNSDRRRSSYHTENHYYGTSFNYHTDYHNNYAIDYRDAEPIFFVERGIEFYVFPTGDFDFNTGYMTGFRPTRDGFTSRRNTVETERGPRGIIIEHDIYGRVRRVGNVFINYDYYGRVRRIGSIYMYYNSFALNKIGGMRLYYNCHGEIIGVRGFINHYNNYGYNPCPAGYNYYPTHNDNFDSEDDFYFYKKDGSKEKMKPEEIETIKRDKEELKRGNS